MKKIIYISLLLCLSLTATAQDDIRAALGVRRLPGLGDENRQRRRVANGIAVPVLRRRLHTEVQPRETEIGRAHV